MSFDINTIILFANFLLYFFWFYFNYKKYKRITSYSFLILWYSIIAGLSALICFNGIYARLFLGTNLMPPIDPWGLVLAFIAFYILLYPFKKLNIIKIPQITLPKYLVHFELFVILASSLLCVLLIPYTINALMREAADVYLQNRTEGAVALPKILYLLITLIRLFSYFFIPYCFYQMRHKVTVKSIYLLAVMFFVLLQDGLIMGSRGYLFNLMGTYFFAFIIFYHTYSKTVKKVFCLYGIIVFSVLTIFGVSITISRVGSVDNNAVDNTLLYFGESFNNFSAVIWDSSVLRHTGGEVYYPTIYSWITGKPVREFTNTQDRIDYYSSIARIGSYNNFSPFYGKLYMEFGVFLPFVVIFIFSFLVNLYLKQRVLHFFQLPLLIFLFHKVYCFAIFGAFLHERDFSLLIYTIIMTVFLKYLIVEKQPITNRQMALKLEKIQKE